MFRLQHLFNVRIVQIDQRSRLQCTQVEPGPHRQHSSRNGNVSENSNVPHDVQIPCCVREVWLDQPEHIDAAREDHETCQPDHLLLIPLQIARKQQHKRNQ